MCSKNTNKQINKQILNGPIEEGYYLISNLKKDLIPVAVERRDWRTVKWKV